MVIVVGRWSEMLTAYSCGPRITTKPFSQWNSFLAMLALQILPGTGWFHEFLTKKRAPVSLCSKHRDFCLSFLCSCRHTKLGQKPQYRLDVFWPNAAGNYLKGKPDDIWHDEKNTSVGGGWNVRGRGWHVKGVGWQAGWHICYFCGKFWHVPEDVTTLLFSVKVTPI